MAKGQDCSLVVSKFELYKCYFIHFWTNIPGKCMTSLIFTYYGFNSMTSIPKECLWH